VAPGDNLWSISKQYDVSVDDLRKWNGLENDHLDVGQPLRLQPGDGTPAARPSHVATDAAQAPAAHRSSDTTVTVKGQKLRITRYIVQKGDNLTSIAAAHGVSVGDLRTWNLIAGDNIRVGQELLIKKDDTGTTAPAAGVKKAPAANVDGADAKKSAQGGKHVYVVKAGDTLYGIARELGVSVSDLKKWNDLGRFLKVGEELVYFTGK
jgi:membrane-bound lytic murein transglycosylase D